MQRLKKFMIHNAKLRMVRNTEYNYYDPEFTDFLSEDYFLKPSDFYNKLIECKVQKPKKKVTLSKSGLFHNIKKVDKDTVQTKNIYKKKKIMHNMLFNAI
jgi:hypothetical protein